LEKLFYQKYDELVGYALTGAFEDADRYFLCCSIINAELTGVVNDCLAGTCALVCYLSSESNNVYIANAGDCRVVLFKKTDSEWSMHPLTVDHNTENPSETKRITDEHPLDPKVIRNGRVKSILRPTRAIGGGLLKVDIVKNMVNKSNITQPWEPPYTTATPEIIQHKIQPDDQFLVLATDGLWELVSNEEVLSFLKELFSQNPQPKVNLATYLIRQVLEKAANRVSFSGPAPKTLQKKLDCLVQASKEIRRKLYDDITITVINLRSGQIWTQSETQAESTISKSNPPSQPKCIEQLKRWGEVLSQNFLVKRSRSMDQFCKEFWPVEEQLWTEKKVHIDKLFEDLGITLQNAEQHTDTFFQEETHL